jgi:hypothetical protein
MIRNETNDDAIREGEPPYSGNTDSAGGTWPIKVGADLESRTNSWPFHSAHFWCGLLAGMGVGLLLGAALVERELLSSQHKAWVSLLGAVLVGIGGLVGRRQSGSRRGADG